MVVRRIDVRERVMARNDELAAGVRERLHRAAVTALNLRGLLQLRAIPPGAGPGGVR